MGEIGIDKIYRPWVYSQLESCEYALPKLFYKTQEDLPMIEKLEIVEINTKIFGLSQLNISQ